MVDQHCDREHVVFVLIQSVVVTAAATVSHLNHVSHFEVAVVSLLVVLFSLYTQCYYPGLAFNVVVFSLTGVVKRKCGITKTIAV